MENIHVTSELFQQVRCACCSPNE